MNVFIIIFAIILFNLIMFVHEFGHFFTSKLFGVKVNEFAIGMGPKIFKFKKGDTLYSLRALPLGGFCELEGEEDGNNSPTSFASKAIWKRMIIIGIGAVMNIILGFILMLILLAQQPKFSSTTVSKFTEDAVSSQSGLIEGDEIISVDGFRTHTFKDLAFSLTIDEKDTFDIDVNRDGNKVSLKNVRFDLVPIEDGGVSTKLDFYVKPVDKNIWTLLRQTFLETVSTVKMVWISLVGIVTGRFSFRNMTGVVGIASVIGKATNEGLKVNFLYAINNVISIMAMITVNLGIVNLLPIPALDGGRLFFMLIEIITGKAINPKYEGWIHAVGFFLIIGLMLIITYSDIVRLMKR